MEVRCRQNLKLFLLIMMVDTADALSLPMSPMVPVIRPHLRSLSYWILADPITFCVFAAVSMMPSQLGNSAKPEAEVGTSGGTSHLRALDGNFNAMEFLDVPIDG